MLPLVGAVRWAPCNSTPLGCLCLVGGADLGGRDRAAARCAVLCCAVLCCAVLCCAVLCCAVVCCAVLRCAVLCCAVLCRAVLYHFRRHRSPQALVDFHACCPMHQHWQASRCRSGRNVNCGIDSCCCIGAQGTCMGGSIVPTISSVESNTCMVVRAPLASPLRGPRPWFLSNTPTEWILIAEALSRAPMLAALLIP
jgi:hypothetical protein